MSRADMIEDIVAESPGFQDLMELGEDATNNSFQWEDVKEDIIAL